MFFKKIQFLSFYLGLSEKLINEYITLFIILIVESGMILFLFGNRLQFMLQVSVFVFDVGLFLG